MDTTSVRYVNAHPAVKSAGFDLKLGKFIAGPQVPRVESLPASPRPPGPTPPPDTASGYRGLARFRSTDRLSPCRPTARRYATARSCANPRHGAVHVWV